MEEQSRVDPIGLFPEEIRQGVRDLAHLGYLRKTVDFCGHTFVLETIRPYMKYAIGQVLEPYRNTIKEPDVWSALHVGTSLVAINGNASFCPPVNDNPTAFIQGRLAWLTGPHGYWQPTIDFLFGKYVEMEMEVANDILELHNFAGRSRDTSQPSPGSLTGQGSSEESTAGDTQPTESSS